MPVRPFNDAMPGSSRLRACFNERYRTGRSAIGAQPCREPSTAMLATAPGPGGGRAARPGRPRPRTCPTGSGTPNGSASPLTTSVGTSGSSSAARDCPAGRAGAAGTPAPARRPRRGRARSGRPPGPRRPAADDQRQPAADLGPNMRRPTADPGLVERRRGRRRAAPGHPVRLGDPGHDDPAPTAASRTASRSTVSTPPPAPWPSTSRPRRAPPSGPVQRDLGQATRRRHGRRRQSPCTVSTVRTVPPMRSTVTGRSTIAAPSGSPSGAAVPAHRRVAGSASAPADDGLVAAPRDEHRPAFPRRGRPPDPVAVADLQRPGQAGSLDVAGAAQRDRGVGRLARRREEDLRIDALTYAARTPGQILVALLERAQQTWIAASGRDLVRAWHPRPSHAPHLPRGLLHGRPWNTPSSVDVASRVIAIRDGRP